MCVNLISMFNFLKKTNLGFWGDLKRPIIVIAPMADVTDVAFRQMFAKYGKPDVMWTEFVSADGLIKAPFEMKSKIQNSKSETNSKLQIRNSKKEISPQEIMWRDLLYFENERPIVAQLFSANPEMMEQAAYLISKAGYDGIDINMGCPEKNIVKQGCGSAMIKNPKQAVKIIRSAKKGIKRAKKETGREIPLSVKTRLGFNQDLMEEWITVLLKENLAAIILHARTKKDMSKVPARWGRVKDAVKLRDSLGKSTLIIGNGDVKSLKDAEDKVRETNCDGVMIGRGVFGNPWFFNKSLDSGLRVDLKNKLESMIEHTKLFEKYLSHKNFNIMKKHYKAYVNGFKGAKELREMLMSTNNSYEVKNIVKTWISDNLVK